MMKLNDAKDEFRFLFMKYLDKVEMTLEEFEEDYAETYEFDNLKRILHDCKRNVPLRIINLLVSLLSIEEEKEASKELLDAWYQVHIHKSKKRMDAFMNMSYWDLAWTAENIDNLICMSDNEIIFVTYLRMLNDEGMNKFEYYVKMVWKNIGWEFEQESYNIPFFSEIRGYKTRLEYMMKLEEKKEIWSNRNIKDREARFEFWNELCYMNDLEKEWLQLFLNLKKHKASLSKGQTVFMTILLVLVDDDRYLKPRYTSL